MVFIITFQNFLHLSLDSTAQAQPCAEGIDTERNIPGNELIVIPLCRHSIALVIVFLALEVKELKSTDALLSPVGFWRASASRIQTSRRKRGDLQCLMHC